MEAEKEEAPVTEETWAKRKAARQRQIDIGKARSEYEAYTNKVPPKNRTANHPKTPDPNDRISKRAFDKKLSVWRRCLHEYDYDQERTDPRYVLTMFSPNTDCTESTRAESEEASSPPPPLPPNSSRQQTIPLPLAELLPPRGSAASVASQSTECSPGSDENQAAAAASRDHPLLQPQPMSLQSQMMAGLTASPLPRPLPVGLHVLPPNMVPNARSAPPLGQAPMSAMVQMQAQMALYSGLLYQMPPAPATPMMPIGASPQPATSSGGQVPPGGASHMPLRHQMPPPFPLWTAETPHPISTVASHTQAPQGVAVMTEAAPEHALPSRGTQERHLSFSSTNSADADAYSIPLTGCDRASVKAPHTAPHLEVLIAGDSNCGDGDSEPRSPSAGRKGKADSEPKTPPMKSMPHAYESPVPGNVNRRSPASFGNTPSPQAGYLRQSACKLNAAPSQPAQQSARPQANAYAAYRMTPLTGQQMAGQPMAGSSGQQMAAPIGQAMAGPTGQSMIGPQGQFMAAPTGLPGQPATPVQRPLCPSPFVQTPGQAPGSGGGMQAGWGSASGSQAGIGPPMFSPQMVFQFGRPSHHIVTPAPPLPFGSPPLRAGNGLTPGPKLSPPENYGGGHDRASAMNEYTAHCMEKWRRSSN